MALDMANLKRIIWIVAVVVSAVSLAFAQEADDLQKQLEQLKQQYEQTPRELRERIAALEQQIKKESEARLYPAEKGRVVSDEEFAAQEAKKAALGQSGQKEQIVQGQLPSAPTYDQLRDAETKIQSLEEQVKSFEFHGLIEALGPTRTFWLYGLLAIASWIFSYYVVPETKGRTLEEIERSWRVKQPVIASAGEVVRNTRA